MTQAFVAGHTLLSQFGEVLSPREQRAATLDCLPVGCILVTNVRLGGRPKHLMVQAELQTQRARQTVTTTYGGPSECGCGEDRTRDGFVGNALCIQATFRFVSKKASPKFPKLTTQRMSPEQVRVLVDQTGENRLRQCSSQWNPVYCCSVTEKTDGAEEGEEEKRQAVCVLGRALLQAEKWKGLQPGRRGNCSGSVHHSAVVSLDEPRCTSTSSL